VNGRRRPADRAGRPAGAAFLAALLAWAAAGSATRPAQAQSAEAVAQLRYEEGLAHYDEGSYEAALSSFRASLETVASPNSRLFVARCLRRLGRLAEAAGEYHLAAQEAADRAAIDPRYAETRRAAEEEERALAASVGWITIEVSLASGDEPAANGPPPDLQVSVDGRAVPQAAVGLALPVDPGRVAVRVAARGYDPISREVVVEPGERQAVAIELRPEATDVPVEHFSVQRARRHAQDPRRRAMLVATFTLLGTSLASAAAFVALAVVTDQQFEDLANQCGDLPCPPGFGLEIDRGRTLQTGTNVALGLALATATTTLVLGILTPLLARGRREAPREVGVRGTALAVRW
jgi:tetratricopeptide (TPR) repeat protein